MMARIVLLLAVPALAAAAPAWAETRPVPPNSLPPPPQVEACVPCHGVDGIARDEEVPHLAGQNFVYLYNQLRAFHTGQRKHKEMNYMSRHLSPDEMESIAQYFAALPRI
jgi:cytochrome c553